MSGATRRKSLVGESAAEARAETVVRAQERSTNHKWFDQLAASASW